MSNNYITVLWLSQEKRCLWRRVRGVPRRVGELNSGPAGFLAYMKEKNYSRSQTKAYTRGLFRKVDTHTRENEGCLKSESEKSLTLAWGPIFIGGLYLGPDWRYQIQGWSCTISCQFSWACVLFSFYKGMGQGHVAQDLQLCFLHLSGLWVFPLRFSISLYPKSFISWPL